MECPICNSNVVNELKIEGMRTYHLSEDLKYYEVQKEKFICGDCSHKWDSFILRLLTNFSKTTLYVTPDKIELKKQ